MEEHVTRVLTPQVGVKFKVPIVERVVERKVVRPGFIVEVAVVKPEIAEPLPAYVELDPLEIGRILAERTVRASGFFCGTGGRVRYADGTDPSLAKQLDGSMVGRFDVGRVLEPADVYLQLEEAIATGRYTLDEVTTFALDGTAGSAIREGAIDHVKDVVGQHGEDKAVAAIAKAEVIPGFGPKTSPRTLDVLTDYLTLLTKRAKPRDVFGIVSTVLKAL
ncbi:MAG: hypothetical protein ACOY3Y_03880 [Acidobacteriota bacterium]